jgi:hypothetical protein
VDDVLRARHDKNFTRNTVAEAQLRRVKRSSRIFRPGCCVRLPGHPRVTANLTLPRFGFEAERARSPPQARIHCGCKRKKPCASYTVREPRKRLDSGTSSDAVPFAVSSIPAFAGRVDGAPRERIGASWKGKRLRRVSPPRKEPQPREDHDTKRLRIGNRTGERGCMPTAFSELQRR